MQNYHYISAGWGIKVFENYTQIMSKFKIDREVKNAFLFPAFSWILMKKPFLLKLKNSIISERDKFDRAAQSKESSNLMHKHLVWKKDLFSLSLEHFL